MPQDTLQQPRNRVISSSKQSHHPAQTSPTSAPLQSSRNANIMNDDTAEKAARRKSAKFGDVGHGTLPSGATNTARKVSALQAQAQHHVATGRKAPRLSNVVQPLPIASMEVMTNNFEEWMKLATDNKITVTNTWNFALIDYFADLTLLRNGPDDQSINFQKASCTLDGCVKIWTSRVDSVATETGKLLSGLTGGDEDRPEGEEGEEEEGGEAKAARKTHRSEATLAKSFAPLQLKKFDLEFNVDPLFKKTCADFDEGGAMGLLMNHLGVDGKGRVVFDAGDAGQDEEEEEELGEDVMVDLEKLRDYIPSSEIINDLDISDTLASFKFSSNPEDMPDFSTLMGLTSSSTEETIRPRGESETPGEAVDFFGDEDFGGPSYPTYGGGGDFDDAASMAGDDQDGNMLGQYGLTNAGNHTGGVGMIQNGEGHGPFDPRRTGQQDLVMALVGGTGEDEGMFDYFDKGLAGKGWAGVEHWKLRKVSRKDPAITTNTAGRPKTVKQPFTIDFTAPSQTAKQLFAPASKQSLSLTSARASTSRASSVGTGSRRGSKKSNGNEAKIRREEWLLPDDMHFSSRQLLRLFLKPKFSLRMRRHNVVPNMEDGEIDENFWAAAAADRADDGAGDTSTPNPFESQFFHDDADDAFVDEALQPGDNDYDDDNDVPSANAGGEEDDLWQGTQGQTLKKAKPENVNFAKKAKRVDVKRLKDDIWSGLKVLVPEAPSDDSDSQPQTPTEEETPKTFDKVIQNLRKTYPKEKMSEISTSFCFICLLHLANEEGLRIETARFDEGLGDVGFMGMAEEGENGEVDLGIWTGDVNKDGDDRVRREKGEEKGKKGTDRMVGELQALKVYKDPNAGRAA